MADNDGPDDGGKDGCVAALMQTVRQTLPTPYRLDGDYICRGDAPHAERICAPVCLSAQARPDEDDAGWRYQLRFRANDGSVRDCLVSARDVFAYPSELVAQLVDRGFHVTADPDEVGRMLRHMPLPPVHKLVRRPGWVRTTAGAYVTRAGTVITHPDTEADEMPVLCDMPRDARALAHGMARDWIDAMAAHQALQSPAGLHATAIGLAPLILRSLGWPSFLVHLHGDTRTAETCARIASSIWGTHEALRLDWSCTARELEDAIIAARDSLVILTSYDATQADKVRAVASALRARDRMPDNGRSVVLSTGSRSIDLSALEPGQTTPFNIDIRSWQLPEDPRKLESALSRCTGAVGQAAVLELQRLSQQKRIGDEYARETAYEQLDAFINASKFSAGASSDRATDAVRAFATLYLALNWNSWILAQAGIEDDMALEVFLASTRAWRDQQHPGDRGDTVVLARIAAQLDALCQDRLAPLTGGQGPEFDAHIDGWMDADWLYLPTNTLRGVANDVGGTTLPALSKLLDAQGLLDTNASRGRTYRMPSGVRGRPSVYKISRRVLDAAA